MGVLSPAETKRQNFEDFALEWRTKIGNMAYRQGFKGPDLEDVVQEVLRFLWEGDYLAKFDPARGRLSTYMYGMAWVRVQDYKRKLGRRSGGEFTDPKLSEADSSYHAVPDSHAATALASTEIRVALAEAFAYLSQGPSTPSRNLAKLFAGIIEQIEADELHKNGTLDKKVLAVRMGISRKAIDDQMRSLLESTAMVKLKETLLGEVAVPA